MDSLTANNDFAFVSRNSALEAELQRQLHLPGRHGVDDLSEAGAADVAVDRGCAEELGMVKHVESLKAELHRFALANPEVFLQRHIKVLQPGAVEEAARRVANHAQRGNAEQRAVEGGLPVSGISVHRQVAAGVPRRVDSVVVDAVRHGAQQRAVGVVVQSDRQSAGEAGDA